MAALVFVTACRRGDDTLGWFLGDGAACDAAGIVTLGPDVDLPFALPALVDLPARFVAGGFTFERAEIEGWDTLNPEWRPGAGAYASSSTEFSRSTVAAQNGRLALSLRAKAPGEAGNTDRTLWGAAYATTAQERPYGLYVSRLAAQTSAGVIFSFFLTHDKVDAAGRNLGWTGPVLQIEGKVDAIKAIFHDSASQRHNVVSLPITPGIDTDHVFALLVLPGSVTFFSDGRQRMAISSVDAPGPYAVNYTYWIAMGDNPAFDTSTLPLEASVDYFARYTVQGCW